MDVYMLKFGLSGIKNIEKYIELDFYKKQIDRSFDPSAYRVKAVYGENGAGKTAIITAVALLRNLIIYPGYLADSANQTKLEELVNKKTGTVKLTAEFYYNSAEVADAAGKRRGPAPVVYSYEVDLRRSTGSMYSVSYEKLSRKRATYSRAVAQVVFEVRNGKVIFLDEEEKAASGIIENTRNLLLQQTFVAAMLELPFKEPGILTQSKLYEHIFNFCTCALRVTAYLDNEDHHDFYFFAESMRNLMHTREKNQGLENVFPAIPSYISVRNQKVPKQLMKVYAKKITDLSSFIKIFKPSLQSIDIDKREDGEVYDVSLLFNYGTYSIDQEFESTGIKKLVKIFDALNNAASGGVSFIDELDANINDVYFMKLIDYMIHYSEGQLCFTTHNVSPMDLLQHEQKGIVFLSQENELIPWTSNGHYAPKSQYQKGMIRDIPFNIDATDFIGILGNT